MGYALAYLIREATKMIKKQKSLSEKLGENLRFERELREISIETAAENADMTSEKLQSFESGDSGISTLEITKLARLYCVSVPRLFEGCNIDA